MSLILKTNFICKDCKNECIQTEGKIICNSCGLINDEHLIMKQPRQIDIRDTEIISNNGFFHSDKRYFTVEKIKHFLNHNNPKRDINVIYIKLNIILTHFGYETYMVSLIVALVDKIKKKIPSSIKPMQLCLTILYYTELTKIPIKNYIDFINNEMGINFNQRQFSKVKTYIERGKIKYILPSITNDRRILNRTSPEVIKNLYIEKISYILMNGIKKMNTEILQKRKILHHTNDIKKIQQELHKTTIKTLKHDLQYRYKKIIRSKPSNIASYYLWKIFNFKKIHIAEAFNITTVSMRNTDEKLKNGFPVLPNQ